MREYANSFYCHSIQAADVGLAMGITGSNVAQSAADIVLLDDKFSSIVRDMMWVRKVYEHMRKFLQFQLTVNIVALCLVFIGACADKPPPLNPVMMLWVNLIMDSLGALALGTEAPSVSLLERRPYKTSCCLVSRPMWRNIFVQSLFQLLLLLLIMFRGPLMFDTHDVFWCAKFQMKDSSSTLRWDPYTESQANTANATISCITFRDVCESSSGHCYDSDHDIVAENLGDIPGEFSFEELNGFREECLECSTKDRTLVTIIFNTFVFCQIFNEFNSRNLFDKWNVLSGMQNNPLFLIVVFVTVVVQILLIQYADKFLGTTSLNISHWLLCVSFAALTIPIGLLMRCIPVSEDANSFFVDNFCENEDGTYDERNIRKDKRLALYKSTESRYPFAFGSECGAPLFGSSYGDDDSLVMQDASRSLLFSESNEGESSM